MWLSQDEVQLFHSMVSAAARLHCMRHGQGGRCATLHRVFQMVAYFQPAFNQSSMHADCLFMRMYGEANG
jgi:hypothetical protein